MFERCAVISKVLSFLCFGSLCFPVGLSAQTLSQTIAARGIDWTAAGVVGGIPNRAVCANAKNSPYNAKGDGTTNDTNAIQSAIDACEGSNKAVLLPAGTYIIGGNGLRIAPGMSLRGEGPEVTKLKGKSDADLLIAMAVSGYNYDYTAFPARDLTAGLSKGSSSITTSADHGWNPGDLILIDQLPDTADDPPVIDNGAYGAISWVGRPFVKILQANRVKTQWTRVIAATARTATIDPPLVANFKLGTTTKPQAVKIKGALVGAGLERLTVDNTVSQLENPVETAFTVNSWIDGVYFKAHNLSPAGKKTESLLKIRGGLNTTIRNSYFEGLGNITENGSQGYGLYMLQGGSHFLIENNIFRGLMIGVAYEGGWSGCVVGYNHFTDFRYKDETERGAVGDHGASPMMNLIEGNFFDGNHFSADIYFGHHAQHTIFRNRMRNDPSKLYNNNLINFEGQDWYNTVLGNILGSAEFITEFYERAGQQNFDWQGDSAIYRLGYNDSIDSEIVNYAYPNVKATLIRHGNWDAYTSRTGECPAGSSCAAGVVWANSIVEKSIPSSLYLTAMSAPPLLGYRTAPAYGPDPAAPAQLRNTTIPAQSCYETTKTSTQGAPQGFAQCYSAASATSATVTVSKTGPGSGAVTSAGGGVICGAACTASANTGYVVTLTARPAAGSSFGGWSGAACSGSNLTCTFTLSADTAVTANFVTGGSASPPSAPSNLRMNP